MVTELRLANPADAALRSMYEAQRANEPAWLTRLRANAFERFEELGFPSVKNEEWKYTNVAPITRLQFEIGAARPEFDYSAFRLPEAVESEFVFVNGKLVDSPANAIDGVVAMNLSEAVLDETYAEIIREHLARSADYVANGFTALNTSFIGEGLFVYFRKNSQLDIPLHLLFVADSNQTATFPRVLIISEENSQATVVESYVGGEEASYLTNSVVEVVLKDGARLNHYRVQTEGVNGFHIATTAAELGSASSYNATAINIGAQISRHDVAVSMNAEGGECWVDGLYLVAGNQHTDTHSTIDHRQPNCSSHQLYKGILDGKSRAVFNGKIFVRHNAQKTDAMQTNKNLLLSNEARVDTKPQLEILADDVKCAHGAAVGQIDEEELFYLETRGIHPTLARNLLTYGFAEEVIEKIKVDSIRARLDEAVLNRLNAQLEVL